MNPLTLMITGGLVLGLFGFAFVAAPHSCEWGLKAYLAVGLGVVAALAALPFLLEAPTPPSRRLLLAAGLVAAGLATWAVGLFAANFRLLCRLF